jgi:hypothetical protein
MKNQGVKFNNQEIVSGLDRIRLAELLILQLPNTHDGRNSWLLNYGVGKVSHRKRERKDLEFDSKTMSAESRNEQLARQAKD